MEVEVIRQRRWYDDGWLHWLLMMVMWVGLMWGFTTRVTGMEAHQGVRWDHPLLAYDPLAVCDDPCRCPAVLPIGYRVYVDQGRGWEWGYYQPAVTIGPEGGDVWRETTYPHRWLADDAGDVVAIAIVGVAPNGDHGCVGDAQVTVEWPWMVNLGRRGQELCWDDVSNGEICCDRPAEWVGCYPRDNPPWEVIDWALERSTAPAP